MLGLCGEGMGGRVGRTLLGAGLGMMCSRAR